MNRSLLLSTSALSLLLGGTEAMAQTSAPPAASEPRVLSEIVVTATRREARVLDIPYNISAVSGASIEESQVQSTAELLRSVPGISVIDRGTRNQGVSNGIQMRGLNVDTAIQGDYAVSAVAPVSTYVNETPLFANFALHDLDRIEVLRGPQGTLYGSGSLGGTVRYILNAPALGRFEGRVSATGSKTDGSDSLGWAADGVLNLPLGDKAALRLSASKQDLPGIVDYVNLYQLDAGGIPVAPNGILSPNAAYYSKKDADTVDIWYARAALRLQPTEAIDLTLSYTAQSDETGGRRQVTRGKDGFGRQYGEYQNGSIQLEPSTRDVRLGALEASIDLGFATLTSSTSYYEHEGDSVSENTGFYAQNGWLAFYYNYPRPMASAARSYSDKAFIEEIRLVSNGDGPLDYVLGAFYERERLAATQTSYLRGFRRWFDLRFPRAIGDVVSDIDFLYTRRETYTDKALFGELTWHFNDKWQATLGVRRFDNRSENNTYLDVPVFAGLGVPANPRFTVSDSKTLFKGNISWKFDENGLAYATISEGYRRGGANAVPLTGRYREDPRYQSFGPDQVINYEVGAKGSMGWFTYNLSLFYIAWKDIQLNTVTPNWGFFVAQNGGRARSQGVEAQVDGRAGAFHYNLGYTYTDAQLTENVFPPTGGRVPVALDGAVLPGTPKHAVTAAVDYTHEMGDGASLTGRLNGYYQSSTRNAVTTSTRLNVKLPPFSVWNASATFAKDKWSGTVFVKNVFNSDAVTGRFTEAYMGTSPGQGYFGNGSKDLITLPRTLGVSLDYAF